MCNLCSGRLFLVPNPCCCCDLRCGVIWAGFCDIIIGLLSIYFPINISIKEENDGSDIGVPSKVGAGPEPVFEISVPILENAWEIEYTYLLQIVSGIMIICASYGMGSHNFSRFLLSCTWLIFRCGIIIYLLIAIRHLTKSQHGPFKRYAIFTSVHVTVDVYLLIVIRYYAMECYDSYRYQRIVTSIRLRRELPTTSKSAPRSRSMRKTQQRTKSNQVEPSPLNTKSIAQIRDYFQKRRETEKYINKDLERVPVWDRKNEIIFFGEDYTDWDPAVFQARWEMLNEKPKHAKSPRYSISNHEKYTRFPNIAPLVGRELYKEEENNHVPLTPSNNTNVRPSFFQARKSADVSLQNSGKGHAGSGSHGNLRKTTVNAGRGTHKTIRQPSESARL